MTKGLQERVAEALRRTEALEAAYMPMTIGELVSLRAHTHGSTVAYDFFERGQRATYAEMERLANQYARALHGFGVRKGDRVALLLPNRLEFPVLWFACAKLGAIMVPINLRYTSREIEFVLRDTQTKFAVVDETAWALFAAMEPWPQDLAREHVIHVGQQANAAATSLDYLIDGVDHSPFEENVGPDDAVMIAYTSGTTGFAKGFALTHEYFDLCTYGFALVDYQPYERYLCWSYLFYSFGQTQLLRSYRQGGTLYVAEKLSSTRFSDWIAKYDIEWCALPELIARQPNANAFKRLKQIRQYLGWSAETIREFRERYGVRGDNNYGMTEFGNGTLFLGDIPEMEDAGSFGHRALFRQLRLVNDDGTPTPVGEVGELWVKGRGMFKGYWNRPDANAFEFEGEWFKTGDLMRCNDLGFYWLIGRKREMYKRAGENISAREVEEVIRELPEVADVAAVPVPDPKRNQEVKIVVELREGLRAADLPVERILEHARERLAVFKVPRYIAYIPKLPRTTSSEKVLKRELMDLSDPLAGVYDSEEKRWR